MYCKREYIDIICGCDAQFDVRTHELGLRIKLISNPMRTPIPINVIKFQINAHVAAQIVTEQQAKNRSFFFLNFYSNIFF